MQNDLANLQVIDQFPSVMSEEPATEKHTPQQKETIEDLRKVIAEKEEEGKKPAPAKKTRRSTTLSPKQRQILNYFKEYRAAEGGVEPTNSQIAEACRCNESTVIKALKKLEELKLLRVDADSLCGQLNAILADAKANSIPVFIPISEGSFQGLRRFEVDQGAVVVR